MDTEIIDIAMIEFAALFDALLMLMLGGSQYVLLSLGAITDGAAPPC